jgi:hypothetical protein
MQRSGISSRLASRYPFQPHSGITSAPVAQERTHGMSVHTVHGCIAGSIIGVVGLVLYVFVAPLLWDLMGVAL